MIARVSTTSTVTARAHATARQNKTERRDAAIVRANAKEHACAAVLAMTVMASPMTANAAVEVGQVAKGDAKSLASDLFAEQQTKSTPAAPKKTKQLASPSMPKAPSVSAPSMPSFSAPSISLPSFSTAKKTDAKAPAAKAAPAPKAKKESGSGSNLGLVMIVLFSPLVAVQAVSFQTLARIAKQSTGK
jgi:hypothetical protein